MKPAHRLRVRTSHTHTPQASSSKTTILTRVGVHRLGLFNAGERVVQRAAGSPHTHPPRVAPAWASRCGILRAHLPLVPLACCSGPTPCPGVFPSSRLTLGLFQALAVTGGAAGMFMRGLGVSTVACPGVGWLSLGLRGRGKWNLAGGRTWGRSGALHRGEVSEQDSRPRGWTEAVGRLGRPGCRKASRFPACGARRGWQWGSRGHPGRCGETAGLG